VSAAQAVHLWDLKAGKLIGDLPLEDRDHLNALCFAPHGRLLAVGTSEGTLFWDLQARRARRVPRPGRVKAITFSPDGKLYVAYYQRGSWVVVRETATGQSAIEFRAHPRVATSVSICGRSGLVVSASEDCTALVWDLRHAVDAPGQLTAEGRRKAWDGLDTAKAKDAFPQLHLLAHTPAETVAMLRKKLPPAPPRDLKLIRRLITELDSDDFPTRERASADLMKLAPLANPELREAARKPASAEVAKRVRALLEHHPQDADSPARLREVRAVQLLEMIATAEARSLLKSLADGEPLSPLTRDAKEALGRFGPAKP
jgi:hypothetical protein